MRITILQTISGRFNSEERREAIITIASTRRRSPDELSLRPLNGCQVFSLSHQHHLLGCCVVGCTQIRPCGPIAVGLNPVEVDSAGCLASLGVISISLDTVVPRFVLRIDQSAHQLSWTKKFCLG